jgi:cytochrome c oxidase assembly protein subunit 11
MRERRPRTPLERQHRVVATSAVGAAVVMLCLSFAAVPLYQAFCRATGYGGTTQVAETAPTTWGARTMTVRLDANVGDLPWKFEPEVPSIRLRTGETKTVFFKVTNSSQRETAGVAAYNVAPDQAGAWFNKISCFCFEVTHIGPGETIELPVVFFLDPALEKEPTMAKVDAVTLSYTFFADRKRPVAAAETKDGAKL